MVPVFHTEATPVSSLYMAHQSLLRPLGRATHMNITQLHRLAASHVQIVGGVVLKSLTIRHSLLLGK